MQEYAIRVKNVNKMYKLYDRNRDRVIDALGLSKKQRYKEHYALHDINFDVKRGETVGIIGTNGAGKSTILKIITGVLSPTEGDLEINGRISALLELGAGFNQEYNGIENVYLNGTMMGFSKEEIDKKLDNILAFADIGDFVYQPVKTYSSGMFVRLAFAVAINIDPEILIVDEALSVGDVFFQSKCYKKFEEFKELGKTILFVSHDLSAISKYCDRAILLNKGTKVGEGTPKDMINKYKRILVGQDGDFDTEKRENDINVIDSDNVPEFAKKSDKTMRWMDSFEINPEVNEYGDGKAKVVDFAVVDDEGEFTSSIIKGTKFQIKTKIRFCEDIDDPIFTMTFKNIKGVDITGTNTMFEKVDTGHCKAGEEYVCTFEQKMNLQGGDYLLSVSCTGYDGTEFVVHDRLYDVVGITVISDKNTVGYYDMESKVGVEKVINE